MGIVYRGRDEALERDVAIKVMSAAILEDRESRERFLREARASARLQHTNIVTIYELGEQDGLPFMALELLEGMDLQRAVEAGIRPDPKLTLPIILQLLAGLGHAHDHGIIHRDVKPSNVFLPHGRPVKIMDFGIARIGGAGLATQGMVVGTPTYMSPEQVKGGHLDGRSDVFSAGLILYELVTGEKCLQGSTIVELLYKVVHQDRDLSALPAGPGWDSLRRVLGKALKRDPDERYAHAQAMSNDLVLALRELGGSGDWTQASDLNLLLRNPRARNAPPTMAEAATIDEPTGLMPTPQPTLRPAHATHAEPTDEMPRDTYRPEPLLAPAESQTSQPAWLIPVLAGSGLVLLVLIIAVWRLIGGPAKPTPAPVPSAALATPTPTMPASATPGSPRPSTAPSPAASPSLQPSPTAPQPTPSGPPPSPSAPAPAPTPVPVQSPSQNPIEPSPAEPTNPRVDKAEKLLEDGRFQAALAEAKAILARDPKNTAAREIAQEAEASLLVEQVLRRAKDALARGEKDDAIEELKKGLSIRPNDSRLLDLWRQATQ
jgi:eukaryotic-like serine/threonine-protein kinase